MKEVEEYYDNIAEREWERMSRHKVEFDIMKRYLKEYITGKSRILDAGGGPGRFSIHLAEQGHQVKLLDLSSGNIELAKKKAKEYQVEIEEFIHGNVLDLSDNVSGQYDVVLCMGPLYHLVDEKDREKAIQECLKKLAPGGLLFVAFISAYAPIIDFIKHYPEEIVNYEKEDLLGYLKDGTNIVSEDNPGFTTAYFMHPEKIEGFMDNFDLDKKVITGLEGITAQSEEKINSLSSEAYEKWLDIIYETSTDPMTWSTCEHFLYIGQKK